MVCLSLFFRSLSADSKTTYFNAMSSFYDPRFLRISRYTIILTIIEKQQDVWRANVLISAINEYYISLGSPIGRYIPMKTPVFTVFVRFPNGCVECRCFFLFLGRFWLRFRPISFSTLAHGVRRHNESGVCCRRWGR